MGGVFLSERCKAELSDYVRRLNPIANAFEGPDILPVFVTSFSLDSRIVDGRLSELSEARLLVPSSPGYGPVKEHIIEDAWGIWAGYLNGECMTARLVHFLGDDEPDTIDLPIYGGVQYATGLKSKRLYVSACEGGFPSFLVSSDVDKLLDIFDIVNLEDNPVIDTNLLASLVTRIPLLGDFYKNRVQSAQEKRASKKVFMLLEEWYPVVKATAEDVGFVRVTRDTHPDALKGQKLVDYPCNDAELIFPPGLPEAWSSKASLEFMQRKFRLD